MAPGTPSPRRLPWARPLLGLALMTAGCGPEIEVEVRTAVGDPEDYELRQRVLEQLKSQYGEGLAQVLRARSDRSDQAGATSTAMAEDRAPIGGAPATPAELDAELAQLRAGSWDDMELHARRIAAASPGAWPALRRALTAEPRAPKGEYRKVLDTIGADVPNRYGHFRRHWQRRHGHTVTLSTHWLEDLLTLPRKRISRALHAVYRDCVARTALLAAASVIGRNPEYSGEVVEVMLETAYLGKGIFRDAVGRALGAVGDEAVPYLLETSAAADKDTEGLPANDPGRAPAFALLQLDRMDRAHPGSVLAAQSDTPRLLKALLTAYGIARSGEAVEPLLEHAGHPDPEVRRAARAALQRFAEDGDRGGSRRTIRLLGGQTTQARAFLAPRKRLSQALWSRLEATAPEVLATLCERPQVAAAGRSGAPEPCRPPAPELLQAYLTGLDHTRAQRERGILEQARAQEDPRAAVALADQILTADPSPAEPAALVSIYLPAARQALDADDPRRAGQLLRKAAMLLAPAEPGRARALEAEALHAEARVPGVNPAGQSMLLDTARALGSNREDRATPALDPGLGPAEAQIAARARMGLLALLTLLAGLWWWGARIARRRSRTEPSDS